MSSRGPCWERERTAPKQTPVERETQRDIQHIRDGRKKRGEGGREGERKERKRERRRGKGGEDGSRGKERREDRKEGEEVREEGEEEGDDLTWDDVPLLQVLNRGSLTQAPA